VSVTDLFMPLWLLKMVLLCHRCLQKLFSNLSFWSRHHNRDVLHDGTLAFDAFLRQACHIIALCHPFGMLSVCISVECQQPAQCDHSSQLITTIFKCLLNTHFFRCFYLHCLYFLCFVYYFSILFFITFLNSAHFDMYRGLEVAFSVTTLKN